MIMHPVQSSNVVAVGYDPDTQGLTIEFNSGTYRYSGVSEKVYESLMSAESVGSFAGTYIKGRYAVEKVR